MSGLFRDEVLQAMQARHLGTIRIRPGRRFGVVAGTALLLAGALVAFAVHGEATRKTPLPGFLVPKGGTLNVTPPQAGQVLRVHVEEGDEVRAGQVLMALHSARSTSEGDAHAAVLQRIEERRSALLQERRLAATQAEQRRQAADERLRHLGAEREQTLLELRTLRQRLALSQQGLQRFDELARGGYVSATLWQQKQEEHLDVQLRERSVLRTMAALSRDIDAARHEREAAATSGQAQVAQLDRLLASVAQEQAEALARGDVVITAPQAGTVTTLGVHAGMSVQPTQTLATVVPHARDDRPSPLEAHLFAASRSVGFVRLGQTVWLRYAAFPYQKFGMAEARIVNVGRTPVDPQDLPAGHATSLLQATGSHEPLYRITAALRDQQIVAYGQPQPLKPGMAFEAHVLQDRRALWEWLLEPLLSVTGRP